MDDLTGRHTALGDELLVLARRHPRETWTTHANLGETARFWLQRHALFRNLDEIIRGGAEATLDHRTETAQFKPWLERVVIRLAGPTWGGRPLQEGGGDHAPAVLSGSARAGARGL